MTLALPYVNMAGALEQQPPGRNTYLTGTTHLVRVNVVTRVNAVIRVNVLSRVRFVEGVMHPLSLVPDTMSET